MKRSVLTATWIIGLAIAAAGTARAEDVATRRYELPNLDTLELVLPAGWQDEVDMPPGGVTLSIRIFPLAGEPFEIFVTPEFPEPTAPDVRDTATLQAAVRDAAARAQPAAVGEPVEIRRLQGESGIGFYFSVTDRAPEPGDFRCMHQGALQAGALTLWFTVLTNDGQEAVVAAALAMLQAARHLETGVDRR